MSSAEIGSMAKSVTTARLEFGAFERIMIVIR